ncbi:hypothetical protein R1sor_024820 [Riccia sorocarpa]|uniref:Uncharacterized protein n=1 Tax=Riccia sorocarpa TaxID=122646 RepID=A0ABD3GVK0_9MARC
MDIHKKFNNEISTFDNCLQIRRLGSARLATPWPISLDPTETLYVDPLYLSFPRDPIYVQTYPVYRDYYTPRTEHSETSKGSKREWLVLWDDGLKLVRNLVEDSSGDKGEEDGDQRIIKVLKKLGLLSFIRTVFIGQDVEICKQFVLHWSQKKKTTRVNGVQIDVSFGKFMEATGLQCEEDTVISEDADQREEASDHASVQIAMIGADERVKSVMKKKVVSLDDFNGSWLQDLLLLLRNTIWMKSKLSDRRLSAGLLQFVSKGMSGERWPPGKLIHKNFISELARLQSRSSFGENPLLDQPVKVLTTSVGPIICFLYAHAVLTRSLANLDVLPSFAGDKIMKISIEFRQGMTRKISYEGERRVPQKFEDDSCAEQETVSGMPSKLSSLKVTSSSCQLHRPGKRRRVQDSVPASSLPRDSSTIEGWASSTLVSSKVLELECTVARQNSELAQYRLRLFKEGATCCLSCRN